MSQYATSFFLLCLLWFPLTSWAATELNFDFYVKEGELHFKRERFSNALYNFERALQKKKGDAYVLKRLGDCQAKLGRLFDARRV